MACGNPIVNYVPGHYTGCATTAKSIADWLINHGGGVLYFNGCFGFKHIYGTSTVSVHSTGRAVDISIRNPKVGGPNNKVMKFLINTYIMPNVCTLGVQRMIFEQKVWESNMAAVPHASWRALKRGASHNDHLHLEVTPATKDRFRYADVNSLFVATTTTPYQPTPVTDPTTTVPVPSTASPFDSAGGSTTGTGGWNGTSSTPVTPSRTTTDPVWSTSIPELGPCAACGEFFDSLSEEDQIQIIHCSGTGAICIGKTNGMTCSTGTAPDIGNFPGPIKDFLFWGNGAYGLSTDGYRVFAMGDAQTPVFTGDRGPWESLYAVSPSVIAVSARTSTGFRVARATVNSIASHTCCS